MANTYTLIASSTVGAGGAATITFSSIPNTYTDLCIKLSARSNSGGVLTGTTPSFNGSSASFTYRNLYGYGTGTGSDTSGGIGLADGGTATASTFSNCEIYIPNYTSSSYKSFSVDAITEDNATVAYQFFYSGLWSNTAAITSITIAPNAAVNFTQYSTAYLYGIKNS